MICAFVPSYDEGYSARHIETVDAHTYYTTFSAVKTKSILTPSFPSTTCSSSSYISPFFTSNIHVKPGLLSPSLTQILLLYHFLPGTFSLFFCLPVFPLSLFFFLFLFSLLQVLPVSGQCGTSQLWLVATLSLTVVWLATPITPSSGLKTGQRRCQTTIVRWCMRTALWSWAMCRRVRMRGRICAVCSSNPSSPSARLSMSQSKVSDFC